MTLLSLLFLPLAWIVTAAGRTLASWLRLPETAAPVERTLVAYGLGLGLLAYGILALGLLGLLYPLVGLLWVLALAVLGAGQHGAMARELGARWGWRREAPPAPNDGGAGKERSSQTPPPLGAGGRTRLKAWGWGVAALFAAFGIIALVGVYAPPVVFIPGVNATEWDSLSYHLADPKIFLGLHRIVSLPWQPHSNFAFTAEMWDTLALMAGGSVPLAKWFSWACAAGAALGTYALGARHLNGRVGLWAALLFASTPLAFWEAGTAYVDGATAFYATLALLCVLNGMTTRDRRWLWPGAVLSGLALSTKASALAFVLLLALGVLAWEWQERKMAGPAIGRAASWGAAALVVGSPWYLKSWACTGNPVYPYFFSVFGGRWWDATRAAAYGASNDPGSGHGLADALLLPWNLTMALPPGHLVGQWPPFNEFPSSLMALSPVLLAALFFPAFVRGDAPRVVKALAIYALAATLFWFLQTQYVRFLLPLVPVYCLLAAWVLCRAVAARSLAGYALAAVTAASLLWSLSVGWGLARVQAPVALGLEAPTDYEARYDAGYQAFQYVNGRLPPDAKVAFFGYTFGFHCVRPYLWGDQSDYVLTAAVHTPESLLARLRSLGVTHVLVDTDAARSGFPFAPGDTPSGWLYALTAAQGQPLYPSRGDPSRGILVYALPAKMPISSS